MEINKRMNLTCIQCEQVIWDILNVINLIPSTNWSMIPLKGTHCTLKYDSVDATRTVIVKMYIFGVDLTSVLITVKV